MKHLPIQIENLRTWHPWLYLETHIIACVAVLSRYSDTPSKIEVYCENIESPWLREESQFIMEVSWLEDLREKAERLRLTVQSKILVEQAAVALSLVLAHRLVRMGQLEVTDYGERTDYRSGKLSSMLEISGTENLSELGRRHREKVEQATANPYGWDVFVVVCAFSARHHRIRISFHKTTKRK